MKYRITTTCELDALGPILTALASAGVDPKIETIAETTKRERSPDDDWASDPIKRSEQQSVTKKVLEAMGANPHSTSQLGDKLERLSRYNAKSISYFLRIWAKHDLVERVGHGTYKATEAGRQFVLSGSMRVV